VTIAACYLSPEGAVLGADSTTTFGAPPGGVSHHFNLGQKVFEVGIEATLGIVIWGLGGFAETSYRTLIADFAEELKGRSPRGVDEAANRWNDFFWTAYSTALDPIVQKASVLKANANRSASEENELAGLQQQYTAGFCIAGNCPPDRTPRAFQTVFQPTGPLGVSPLANGLSLMGAPNLALRLLHGIDPNIFRAILDSKDWHGTETDLLDIVSQHQHMPVGMLPLRDAIDWVHTIIYTTIKGMKFSHFAPICGGPIEIAVLSSDRPFRWVHHKRFSAAIESGLGGEQ
jgi:hypothetical protein